MRRNAISINRADRTLRSALLLLLLGVLVPAACVLWFMNAAIHNERLLARQRLDQAWSSNLALLGERVRDSWVQRSKQIVDAVELQPASATFAQCIRKGLADSVVRFDLTGRPLYPAAVSAVGSDLPAGELLAWRRAADLENVTNRYAEAAQAYSAIAARAATLEEKARALQAQTRCLSRAKQAEAATVLVVNSFGDPKLNRVADSMGRLIAADVELLALQLLGSRRPDLSVILTRRLQVRLNDYSNPALPSAQRRFLATEAKGFGIELATLAAEDLAAEWMDEALQRPRSREAGLKISGLPGIWQWSDPKGQIVALFRHETLLAHARNVIRAQVAPAGVQITLLEAGASLPQSTRHVVRIGEPVPDWRLVLVLDEDRLLQAETERQTTAYLWTAALVISAIAIVALLIAEIFRRERRVARLKNDLVATVSHELKTPLASMRLLVDTLLDTPGWDPARVREYLEMISRENHRLSRLIDNFLTFSRMERNKQAFEFRPTSAAEVVRVATDALEERLHAEDCDFSAEIEAALPPFAADPDSLSTVLVNLLDNALKYSTPPHRVALKVYADTGSVCFSVSDNGAGLSQKEQQRVFERFYQVDRRLSRVAGGCGLGLSIVDFIVRAHGGQVRVESEPGRGSTFTVMLPAALEPAPAPVKAMA